MPLEREKCNETRACYTSPAVMPHPVHDLVERTPEDRAWLLELEPGDQVDVVQDDRTVQRWTVRLAPSELLPGSWVGWFRERSGCYNLARAYRPGTFDAGEPSRDPIDDVETAILRAVEWVRENGARARVHLITCEVCQTCRRCDEFTHLVEVELRTAQRLRDVRGQR